jgi:EAL domain-containing protein (putative c-di-GMP-specific phosphodiesterase class I)
MHSDLVERLKIAADLRHALDAQEFVLHYQPTLALGTGEITGLEALIRWQHSTRGLVPPGQFIPLAEETGLIRQMGRWVLEQACRQAVEWQERWGPLTMSVNISASQLRQADLVDDVRIALEASGLAPRWLELEITESVMAQSIERAAQILARLRELGVRVALDDFGTGYSALAHLKHFPIDTLKVDRAFVAGLPDNADDAAIARAIIAMGRSMRFVVVAEGVETSQQHAFLEAYGCDEVQGFLFSQPLGAAECAEYLRSHARQSNTVG